MTVASTVSPSKAFAGDGVTTVFNLPFIFFDAADLQVVERVIATGAETLKTLSTHYTVSGGSGSTGSVTALAAPAASVQWVIRRKAAIVQSGDFAAAPPEPVALMRILDRLVLIEQELRLLADRGLHLPMSDGEALATEIPNSVNRASKLLGFDASGNPVAHLAASLNILLVTAFGASLLDDADAAAGRLTLGVPMYFAVACRSGGANQTGLADGTWTKVLLDGEVLDPFGKYDAANSRYAPGVAGRTLVIARVAWASPESGAGIGTHLGKNDALYTSSVAVAQGAAFGTFSGFYAIGVVDHTASDTLCVFGVQDTPSAVFARDIHGAVSQTGAIYITFAS